MAERGGWSGDDEFDDFDWTEPPPRQRRRRSHSETGEGESLERESPEGESLERESPEREALERELGLPVEGETVPVDLGGYPSPESEAGPFGGGESGRATAERRRSTSEYERVARRPHPTGEHRRHRDLPAKVRRRQAIAAGAIALIVVIGLIVLIGGGGGGGEQEQPLPLKRVVGQTIIGKVGKEGASERLLRSVRKGQLGGVIVLPRNERTLEQQVGQLQDAAKAGGNPPLLVMIDQEGGEVKRLPGPPDQSPPQIGESGDADVAREQGDATGTYLAGLGVNVDLAPVLDVERPTTADTIASRTFGDDPNLVSELGVAFIEGLQGADVAATAKHFPGLGLATVNPDDGPVTVAATEEDLSAAVAPFQDAVEAGVDMVMMSTAAYPGLGSREPAALAPQIVQGLLRDQLGFEGVIITDDLEGDAIADERDPANAAIAALAAGNDLAVFARSARTAATAFDAVVKAAKAGELDRGLLDQAYARVATLKAGL
ncbi:MAG TPA: glycoside hydrolase family 3 N-terminal domain-containing protein [Candidatus Acidoferrum sp.]|nr:glycoside hydrolase family 3 N-terminal domain-containing protein [Candidatus Acidoferrum sp.]